MSVVENNMMIAPKTHFYKFLHTKSGNLKMCKILPKFHLPLVALGHYQNGAYTKFCPLRFRPLYITVHEKLISVVKVPKKYEPTGGQINMLREPIVNSQNTVSKREKKKPPD